MNKKIIFILISVLLISIMVLPCFAVIPPALDSPYIDVYLPGNFDHATFYASDGSGYTDKTYTTLLDAHYTMGTNDIEYVSKPEYYIGVERIRVKSANVVFNLDSFLNQLQPFSNGFYNLRFGVYTRPNCNIEAVMICQNDNDGTMLEIGRAKGVYIGTGSAVRGTYYYFDLVFPYLQTYTELQLQLNFTPLEGETTFLFTGTEPLYSNSFVSFTAFYYSKWSSLEIQPYPKGTVLQEQGYGNRYVYLNEDAKQVVGSFYIPEIGQTHTTTNYLAPAVIEVPGTNIVYYYVPMGSSYGYLYKGLIVDEDTAYSLGFDDPFTVYQKAYLRGQQSVKEKMDELNAEWQKRYDQLVAAKGNNQDFWYDLGYNDGYNNFIRQDDQVIDVLGRGANLVRAFFNSVGAWKFLGVSIAAVVAGTASIVCAMYLFKKFR